MKKALIFCGDRWTFELRTFYFKKRREEKLFQNKLFKNDKMIIFKSGK